MALQHIIVDSVGNGIDWLTPVATVAAVFLGGIVNYVVQSRLSDRRWEGERAQAVVDAEAERMRSHEEEMRQYTEARIERLRVQHAEERAAALVLQGDLSMVASILQDMTVDPRWYAFYTFAVPNWERLQLTVARADRLTLEDWEAVSQSTLELEAFDYALRRLVGRDGPRVGESSVQFADDEDQATVRGLWLNATKAHNVLAKLSGSEPITGLLHADATHQAEPLAPSRRTDE